MASKIDIINLALAHIADEANVSGISPVPDSEQAERAATYYPFARDEMLEMHDWKFASTRATVAETTNLHKQWVYAYQVPSNYIAIRALLDANASGNFSAYGSNEHTVWSYSDQEFRLRKSGEYTPQPFEIEIESTTNEWVLYCNIQSPVIRYTFRQDDPSKYSPLATQALSRLLASYLAGPILRDEAGERAQEKQYNIFLGYIQLAAGKDANQQKQVVHHSVPWLHGRN